MDYEKLASELEISHQDLMKSYKELGLHLYNEYLKVCEKHGEEPTVEIKTIGIVFGSLS